MRGILSYLVILHHSMANIFLYTGGDKYEVRLLVFIISNITVPIFFMISGALLIPKVDGVHNLIRRIVRFVVILLVFSVLTYIFTRYNVGKSVSDNMVICVRLIVQSYVVGTYWYLYAYIFILLIIPLIRKLVIVLSFKDVMYIWLIFAVVYCIPALFQTFSNRNVANTVLLSMIPQAGIYILYFITGYYIYSCRDRITLKYRIRFVGGSSSYVYMCDYWLYL